MRCLTEGRILMRSVWFSGVAAGLLLSGSLMAQAPAGATGQCKDGSYSTATHKAGACSGHKGVQSWYATGGSGPLPSPPAVTHPVPAPNAPAQRPAPTASSGAPAAARAQATGGAGLVWVNTSSKVYHCYGGRDYGTTKNGKYESEASARAEGARPAYGKSCGQ